jgi:hypothetical protein
MNVFDFRFRLLAFRGACGEPPLDVRGSTVLLRLKANPIEAGFASSSYAL